MSCKGLKIVKEQETISQKLLEAEATNRLRHLEILRELSEVKSNIDEQQSIIDISKNDLEQLNFSYNEQLNNGRIRQMITDFTVELGTSELTVGEVMGMQAGDVVKVFAKPNEELKIKI